MFWVGATVVLMAWVDQQNGGGVGLAQKREGRAEEDTDESVGLWEETVQLLMVAGNCGKHVSLGRIRWY